jgi:hypothetical protein
MVSSAAHFAACNASTSARRTQAAKLGHQLIKRAPTPLVAGLQYCDFIRWSAHNLLGYCALTTMMPYSLYFSDRPDIVLRLLTGGKSCTGLF